MNISGKRTGTAADTQWLELRRQCWYAVVYVPPRLHALLGKKLRRSLNTRDLREAQLKRHPAIADFKRQIADAERAPQHGKHQKEAMELRATLGAAQRGQLETFGHSDPTWNDDGDPDHVTTDQPVADRVLSYVAERAEQIEVRHGLPAAQAFYGIASGTQTPLLLHLLDWLNEGGRRKKFEPRTRVQFERDLGEFAGWLKKAGLPQLAETVDRRTVGRFVTEHLGTSGRKAKTQARIISACQSYWAWLARRGLVDGDKRSPWEGQAPPKERDTGGAEERERGFRPEEMVLLLNGPADSELHDLMRIAALSGMRIDEPYRLLVRDCAGGVFNLRRAKTQAGVRVIPTHSGLTEIVARRTEGKDPEAWLFPEAGPLRPGRERSMMASKRFGLYRNRQGVNENVPGKRTSLVTFHSFRRFFVTASENAGVELFTTQQIVGHKAQGITRSTYTDPSTMEKLRLGVEAVKLPPGVLLQPPTEHRQQGKGGRKRLAAPPSGEA